MFRQTICVAVVFACFLIANTGKAGPKKSDTVSVFELRTLEPMRPATSTARASSKLTSLADQAAGHHLLVAVYPEADCLDCKVQLSRLAKYQRQFKQLGTKVIAIADQKSRLLRHAAMTSSPVAIAHDPSRKLIRRIAARDARSRKLRPSLVLFDRCGKERARLIGGLPGLALEPAMLKVIENLDKTGSGDAVVTRCVRKPAKLAKSSQGARI
jgi:peroxiredoxin